VRVPTQHEPQRRPARTWRGSARTAQRHRWARTGRRRFPAMARLPRRRGGRRESGRRCPAPFRRPPGSRAPCHRLRPPARPGMPPGRRATRRLDGAGEGPGRCCASHLGDRVEGRDDQQVADDEGTISADREMQRRQAAPLRRPVDDVVVHERRELEELDRDRGGHECRRRRSERRSRGEDEGRAEELRLADHGCDLRAAAAGCGGSKPAAAVGELGPVAGERQGAGCGARLLVDPLSHVPPGRRRIDRARPAGAARVDTTGRSFACRSTRPATSRHRQTPVVDTRDTYKLPIPKSTGRRSLLLWARRGLAARSRM